MIHYWFEARKRVIQCAIAYGLCFLLSVCFFDKLYLCLTYPLDLNAYGVLVSSGITEPLLLPFKVANSVSWLLVLPFILFQGLYFAMPALYPSEKKLVKVVSIAMVLLFYVGASFGFFFVEPMLLQLIQTWVPSSLLFLPSISSYLAFCIDMACAFGVVFEVPVVLMVCIIKGWLSVSVVRQSRSWWVVGIFALSMVVTPPDVYSQVMLALPLWLMVELVLVFAVFLQKHLEVIVTSD